ncbi:MAG: prepilin-type N-terminal cleavage/methylation domain-containing protein [Chitinivibrionales bacterium]|nr:prepilin-type N-terminal cleavage/methylation domain-containing protein [Chitinivibrionales bacterium]MBD3355567.1 prepilin-type N-terminal cleavage/methylation domain-containing protein [Chitinivibrionales bacterium]
MTCAVRHTVNKQGMTIIELMLVMVIAALGLLAVTPSLMSVVNRRNDVDTAVMLLEHAVARAVLSSSPHTFAYDSSTAGAKVCEGCPCSDSTVERTAKFGGRSSLTIVAPDSSTTTEICFAPDGSVALGITYSVVVLDESGKETVIDVIASTGKVIARR